MLFFTNFWITHPCLWKICRKGDPCLENLGPKDPPIWAAHTRTVNMLCTLPPQGTYSRQCLSQYVEGHSMYRLHVSLVSFVDVISMNLDDMQLWLFLAFFCKSRKVWLYLAFFIPKLFGFFWLFFFTYLASSMRNHLPTLVICFQKIGRRRSKLGM